jgi:hypothetical protein
MKPTTAQGKGAYFGMESRYNGKEEEAIKMLHWLGCLHSVKAIVDMVWVPGFCNRKGAGSRTIFNTHSIFLQVEFVASSHLSFSYSSSFC